MGASIWGDPAKKNSFHSKSLKKKGGGVVKIHLTEWNEKDPKITVAS